jgi:hypothetical protein
MKLIRVLFALLFLVGIAACSQSEQVTELEPAVANTVQIIIDDMTLSHEAKLHGVPDSYDWSARPRIGMGNISSKDGVTFRSITAWGQVYEAANGNPAWNSRVHLRNIRTWVLSKRTNTWKLLQAQTVVEGGAFKEDFQGNANRPADIRAEPSGGISVTAGNGYNFHFWPKGGRAAIDPNDIKGVFTTVLAMLVLNDPKGPDDRRNARYLLGMGADYWLNQTIQWQANPWVNGDVAIARHKFVKPYWQSFSMTTLSADELRRNPPPPVR